MPTLAELQKRSPLFVRPSEPQLNQETLISDLRGRLTATEMIDRKLRAALERSASRVLSAAENRPPRAR